MEPRLVGFCSRLLNKPLRCLHGLNTTLPHVQSQRWLSSGAYKTPSPYVVLNLRTSASEDDIKAAFRKLAKQNHPDLNPDTPRSEAELKMSEIIEAYNQLMDDDFGGRVGDSRVALACEMYTIDELRLDRLHDVYSIRITYVNNDDTETTNDTSQPSLARPADVSSRPIVEVDAHPDDSVSDLKRKLQARFAGEWGLSKRRLDRDGIATGWELVADLGGAVLSYHLFLHTYRLKSNDVIHAVVRRYNEVEREASTL